MKIYKVLQGIAPNNSDSDFNVQGIAYDSRKVQKDYLFVAIKGLRLDGHLYLKQAQKNGARAALVQEIDQSIDLPQIKVDNTRLALAKLAANYYSHPTKNLNLVGVTGTNGKTTTTYMLESIYKAAGQKTGLLGTINYRIGEQSFPVSHTTPESLELQEFFAKMNKAQVQTAVMEVSSHASYLHRIDECCFDQLLFTNLTQDHLDFHKNFNDYFSSKKRLFAINPGAAHIVNIDDQYGAKLVNHKADIKVETYGLNEQATFKASKIKMTNIGSAFVVNYKRNFWAFEVRQCGLFNIYNALAAIASAVIAGLPVEKIQEGLSNLTSVPGRFENLSLDKPFKVIVDYAHTPDGLENVLNSARQITKGRLITVFGCGGERDKGKRPLMGDIAARLADIAIVTSDNPRSEDPLQIVKEITAGNSLFVVQIDRRQAICEALKLARDNDTVVIAGKGHEVTQEINGELLPFDDKEVVMEIVRSQK